MKSQQCRFHSMPLNSATYIFIFSLLAIQYATAALPDTLTIDVGDIDGDSINEILVLEKRSLRSAANYKFKVWDRVNGYQDQAPPEVRTYRGHVQGDPDMRVNANIEANGSLNANLSDGRNINIRLTNQPIAVSGADGSEDPGTGNTTIPLKIDRTSPTPKGYIIPRYHMRRIQLAVEIQNDYYADLGSDIDTTIARMEQRVNDTDFFYARDMGIAWEITTVVIRLEPLETSWQAEWKDILFPDGAVYNTAIRFKKPGGGGAAGNIFDGDDPDHRVYGTVGTTSAYSRSLGHEVGHQFSAGHQSSWDDIMQGAASCLGAGTVERLIDHSHVALEAAAPEITYGAPLPPFAMEDGANTQMNQTLEIDLLENDYDGNGDAISLEMVDSMSKRNGTVEIVANGVVRFTPAHNFLGLDEFAYHVSDSTGLTNRHGYAKIYVRNNGLATRIQFNETSGSIVRDSGPYHATGTLTNGLSFGGSVSGKVALALQRALGMGDTASADFEGVGDPMEGSLSVSLWVKYAETPSGNGVLICKGGTVIPNRFDNPRGGWFIGHTEDGRFRFAGNLQRDLWENPEKFDRESSPIIETDTWYHLAMVIDRPNQIIRAWINNEEVLNSNWTSHVPDGLINSTHSPLVIFNSEDQQNQGDWFGPATIDEVEIYNQALTPDEIALLYSVEDDSDSDDLPDFWEFLSFGDLSTANATSNRDGDRASDAQEYAADTSPTDIEAFLGIESIIESSDKRTISWRSAIGQFYQIQYTDTLDSFSWETVANEIIALESLTSWIDENQTRIESPRRFYRVKLNQ